MEIQKKTYLYGHTSQETAYIVDGYPWGFRLRTQIRYWIETSNAKNGGQRFVSQTVNPKTGRWCAPKKSTYSPIMIMLLDEKNHVGCTSLNFNASEERVNEFKDKHLEKLDDFQRNALKEIIAYTKVMKNVTFSVEPSKIGPVSLFSNDPEEVAKRKALLEEQEERKKKEAESMKNINMAIAYEMRNLVL